jgi:uncharacterized protein (DUF302 family)
MTTALGFQARLSLPYDEAMQKTIAALKTEGFGVLTEIDVKATMKQKLDVEFRRFTILGACSPPLAHRALSANLDIGLLLPCNVTVYEDGDETVVTAVDPEVMMGAFKDDVAVCDVAAEARLRLKRAMAKLNTEITD